MARSLPGQVTKVAGALRSMRKVVEKPCQNR